MSGTAGPAGDETGRVERLFDRFADGYDRQIGWSERVLLGDARGWAVAQARGSVLEIGAGTGLNLPLYGDGVGSVVAVDISERMLAIARDRVPRSQQDRITVRHGDVQRLDLLASSVDTVVSTYTFCTIPDPDTAAREAWRVLRPGGVFVLAEHGPARRRLLTAVMRLVEPVMVRLAADYLTRDPVPVLRHAGFDIESVARSGRGGVVFRIVARKPVTGADR